MKVKAFFLCRKVLPSPTPTAPHISEAALGILPFSRFPIRSEFYLFLLIGHEPMDAPRDMTATVRFTYLERLQFEEDFKVHLTEDSIEWTSIVVRPKFEAPGRGRFVVTFVDSDASADWPVQAILKK